MSAYGKMLSGQSSSSLVFSLSETSKKCPEPQKMTQVWFAGNTTAWKPICDVFSVHTAWATKKTIRLFTAFCQQFVEKYGLHTGHRPAKNGHTGCQLSSARTPTKTCNATCCVSPAPHAVHGVKGQIGPWQYEHILFKQSI